MQFNVSTLLKEYTGASREHDIDDTVLIDGRPQRLRGHARFDRTPDGILVRAALTGETEEVCSRCLRPFVHPVEVRFDEQYIPLVDVETGRVVEAPEGIEDAYRITQRHMLDLGDAVRQYWEMALPMAAVCREDCPGLCPDCGQDRAADGHACAGDQDDARWSKLRDLKLR